VAIRNGQPVRFTPKGICDAFDATDAFPGACALLTNLIFDQANPEVMVSRPGVGPPLTNFGSLASGATFVSGFITVGAMVYGMVTTSTFPGFDQAFAFSLLTNSFVAISGQTNANSPASPLTTGAWTPPTFAVISTKIIVTHPGFSGSGSNFFGVIDISNPAAPTWTSANLATNPLTGVPTSVANYNNRAYFSVLNFLEFSDVLAPTTRTNASQAITVGDTTPITAQAGLPIQTTSAGVVGALVVFKQSQIWQVTGDPATNNLALNYISLTTGCIAPRSVVQGPFGIFFIGVDAPYILNFLGVLAPLSHTPGNDGVADVQVPFQNATTPSRIAASFSGNIFRVCVATIIQGTQQTNDYWYDIRRKRWTGPHSFTYDAIAQFGNNFVISGIGHGAALFLSQSLPAIGSVYTDNGVQLISHLRSSSFPKTGHMAEVQVVESTQEFASSGFSVNYNITALDDQNNTLNSTFVATPAVGITWGGGALWGGGAQWSSSSTVPHVYTIPWTAPLVFQKMALDITATSSNSLSIGTFFARYQDTGYTNQG
jgi:hypothetical protein